MKIKSLPSHDFKKENTMADHEVKKSMQRNTEKRQQPEAVTDQPNAHAMK